MFAQQQIRHAAKGTPEAYQTERCAHDLDRAASKIDQRAPREASQAREGANNPRPIRHAGEPTSLLKNAIVAFFNFAKRRAKFVAVC